MEDNKSDSILSTYYMSYINLIFNGLPSSEDEYGISEKKSVLNGNKCQIKFKDTTLYSNITFDIIYIENNDFPPYIDIEYKISSKRSAFIKEGHESLYLNDFNLDLVKIKSLLLKFYEDYTSILRFTILHLNGSFV